MSTSSESAEQFIRLCLDETEFALKITGSAVKNIIAALYVISKDTNKSIGKTRLKKMLKSEKETKIFSVKKNELKIFAREAKNYGIPYCAIANKKHKKNKKEDTKKENKENNIDDIVDIMVRAEDAPKINRIVERFKLNTIEKATIKSEITKELDRKTENIKQEDNLSNNILSIETENKDIDDSMIDDIFSKPEKESENQLPLQEQMKKNSQLEPSSMSKKNLEEVIKVPEKKSVKKELEEIETEQKNKTKLTKSQISKTNNTLEKPVTKNKERGK